MSGLLWLIVLLVIVGIVMYWVPMDAQMKRIVYIVICIALVLVLAYTLLGAPPQLR